MSNGRKVKSIDSQILELIKSEGMVLYLFQRTLWIWVAERRSISFFTDLSEKEPFVASQEEYMIFLKSILYLENFNHLQKK